MSNLASTADTALKRSSVVHIMCFPAAAAAAAAVAVCAATATAKACAAAGVCPAALLPLVLYHLSLVLPPHQQCLP